MKSFAFFAFLTLSCPWVTATTSLRSVIESTVSETIVSESTEHFHFPSSPSPTPVFWSDQPVDKGFVCVNELSCSENGICSDDMTDCVCSIGYYGKIVEPDRTERRCAYWRPTDVVGYGVLGIFGFMVCVLLILCCCFPPRRDRG